MKIMTTNVQILKSVWWYRGWALDFHTIRSVQMPDGYFDTERSELGEALFLLKYRDHRHQIQPLADTVTNFLKSEENQWWFRYVNGIIPVPPSNINRPFQPVLELARAISIKSGIKCDEDFLTKVKETEELKNVDDAGTRSHQLEDAFSVKDNRFSGETVLVFDDLYRSGETLESICKIIKEKGHAKYIYVLTITKTRKKR